MSNIDRIIEWERIEFNWMAAAKVNIKYGKIFSMIIFGIGVGLENLSMTKMSSVVCLCVSVCRYILFFFCHCHRHWHRYISQPNLSETNMDIRKSYTFGRHCCFDDEFYWIKWTPTKDNQWLHQADWIRLSWYSRLTRLQQRKCTNVPIRMELTVSQSKLHLASSKWLTTQIKLWIANSLTTIYHKLTIESNWPYISCQYILVDAV